MSTTTRFEGTLAWDGKFRAALLPLGNFEGEVHVGWRTTFVHTLDPVGYAFPFLPPGLTTGLGVGFKAADVPILGTIDIGVDVMVPIATPSREGSPPPVVLLTPFSIGGSF